MSNDYSLFFTIDPLVNHLPMIHSPFVVAQIICLYLYVVLKWGPAHMKNRPAYNIRPLILFYNLTQIFFNLYMIYCGLPDWLKKNYFELAPDENEYILSYSYFMLKIYDLFETLMFVFRKKQGQVSFLHIYHHIMVLTMSYFQMRCLPGGHNMVYGLANTITHSIMYTYYFIAAYDSKIKWLKQCKKYITQVQLTQFVVLFIHYIWPLYYGHCCISQTHCAMNCLQAVIMIVLFGNFYIQNYIKKAK